MAAKCSAAQINMSNSFVICLAVVDSPRMTGSPGTVISCDPSIDTALMGTAVNIVRLRGWRMRRDLLRPFITDRAACCVRGVGRSAVWRAAVAAPGC